MGSLLAGLLFMYLVVGWITAENYGREHKKKKEQDFPVWKYFVVALLWPYCVFISATWGE